MSIRDFDLDLARAITEQLVEHFAGMAPSPLSPEEIARARREPGVYQLFLRDELVYVGKSDSNLLGRLDRHRSTLTGRQNIAVADMSFKGIHISKNWSALTTEAALIRHFGNIPWNNSGFGSNDPGRNRDDTAVPPNSFDGMFPIDPSIPIELETGQHTAAHVLATLKRQLPYLLRFGQSARERQELSETTLVVPAEHTTAREALRLVASSLPEGWQATALPGRMLLYREQRPYPAGEIIWPIPG